ncbi:MAG: ATP-binding protein [Cyclonatronaceae bacterium]
MQIDRKLSTIIRVIERIYLPTAQGIGTSLFLKNQIDKEIHFPPGFFINLIQITGNLVANAFKFTPSNGSVEVVFTLDTDEGQNILNMAITYFGRSIPHDLVSALSQGKITPKPTVAEEQPCFAARLHHVMQIVSKEKGRIFMENENGSETTFLLTFPIPDKYLNQKNGFHPIVKKDAVLQNGSKSSSSRAFSKPSFHRS